MEDRRACTEPQRIGRDEIDRTHPERGILPATRSRGRMESLLYLALLLLGGCASPAPRSSDPPADGAPPTGDYLRFQGRRVVLRNEIKKITTPDLHGRVFSSEFRVRTVSPTNASPTA